MFIKQNIIFQIEIGHEPIYVVIVRSRVMLEKETRI